MCKYPAEVAFNYVFGVYTILGCSLPRMLGDFSWTPMNSDRPSGLQGYSLDPNREGEANNSLLLLCYFACTTVMNLLDTSAIFCSYKDFNWWWRSGSAGTISTIMSSTLYYFSYLYLDSYWDVNLLAFHYLELMTILNIFTCSKYSFN